MSKIIKQSAQLNRREAGNGVMHYRLAQPLDQSHRLPLQTPLEPKSKKEKTKGVRTMIIHSILQHRTP